MFQNDSKRMDYYLRERNKKLKKFETGTERSTKNKIILLFRNVKTHFQQQSFEPQEFDSN